MKRRHASILLGVVSAVGVLLLAMAASEKQSPGRVSTVHGRIPELDGGEACSSCHGGWFGDMQSACSECHADVAAQIEARKGLHGSLQPALAATCSTCHSEHHGDDFRLVNRLAFAQAGVQDPAKFDHRSIGYVIEGVHARLSCSECHPFADADLVPEGQKRFLGLSQDCASCHRDPHGGLMQFACVTCHGQETFAERFVQDHDRWLPLTGAHGAAACRDCHAENSDHALEQLSPGSRAGARQCNDCHQSPHSVRFVAANAAAGGFARGAVCVDCHRLEHESFADPRLTISPDQHRHGGFALSAPHHTVACASCHAPGAAWAERHPGRGQRECRACHQDPHEGQFDGGAFAANGCVGCHAETHFVPHQFDGERHARTALPLDGRHAELECRACHDDPAAGAARRFHGTPSRCEQCHADAHRGAFAHAAQRLAARPRGTCAECHTTTAFADVRHERFDHLDFANFALDGAHGQIDCTDCHARTAQPDEFGRRFGRIPVREGSGPHGGATADCTTCHGDPHDGIFDRQAMPRAVDGREGCRRCHDTASFRALPYGFDHGAFAGFPLTGRHGELGCADCHQQLDAPSLTGRTWGKARGNRCADCHHDPHQQQFERLGRTDCSRCHKSTVSFATLSFRHNLDSRFPIEEQHQKVACSSCHKAEAINGRTVVRYKPLPTDCVDCHGREEGGAPFRRRRQ